jgi:hypothetical protein
MTDALLFADIAQKAHAVLTGHVKTTLNGKVRVQTILRCCVPSAATRNDASVNCRRGGNMALTR